MTRRPQLLVALALLALCGARAAAQTDRFSAYGFFDLRLDAANRPGAGPWSFNLKNLNVISMVRLDPRWRVLAEVEWEHDTDASEQSSGGELELERAYVEYRPSGKFGAVAGKFMTPFGLYNIRHDATPSFVSVDLPGSLYEEHANTSGDSQMMFSKFGAGLLLSGSLPIDGWDAEYSAYLSNGRGPTPYAEANNPGKGIGGRFIIRPPGNVLQLGASWYGDRNGEAHDSRQSSFAVDASVRYAGVLVEAEGFAPRLERVNAKGVPTDTFRTGRGFYVQASRPLAGRLSAFALYDSYDPDVSAARDAERDVAFGLNFAQTGAIFLKGEVHFRRFENPVTPDYEQLRAAIAVAF